MKGSYNYMIVYTVMVMIIQSKEKINVDFIGDFKLYSRSDKELH